MNNFFTVYRTAQEIFTNNKYLDILKSKDYILKIKPDEHTVKYTIVDKPVENKKNDTQYDKLIKIINETSIINLAHTKKQFWKFKYLEQKICNKTCYTCSYTCLSINYLLKKYMKCKLINKTILTISHTPTTTSTYYLVEAYGSLFNPNVLYLFDNCKNCNIYCILNTDNDTYKQTIVHKNNNNTYHLLNYNKLDKKLNNIIFDNIILYGLHDKYINNVLLTYLDIIASHSNENTRLLMKIEHNMLNLLVSVLSIFNNIKIYNQRVDGFGMYICAYNFKQHSIEHKNIIKILKHTTLNKYVDIQISNPTYITKFIDKIITKSIDKYIILFNILDVYDTSEYNIIMQTIHTKQKYYAQTKKYKKLLTPY